MAKTSKAQLMSQAKFKADKRDTLTVDLPKGAKAGYKVKAANLGLSLTALIQRAIDSYGVGNESVGAIPALAGSTEKALTAEQRKILDAIKNLPPQAQKSLLKFLQSLKDNA